MTQERGVAVGAGYFSAFHYDAWKRIPEVEITALCDLDEKRRTQAAAKYGIPRHYARVEEMLDREKPDFVDIITPPGSHRELSQAAAQRGIAIICQKPLAPTFSEAQEIVAFCRAAGVRFMVHENFRFQPWHREIKRLLDAGALGRRLHSLTFRSRPGDGWGADAYLSRQPYFRTMPRLLVYETGVHFIDTFRYLAGEITRVYALLRKLNPVIAGEDCGLLLFEFQSGTVGLWDANRFNESTAEDPRYTFGEFLVEGEGGSIRLGMDGSLTVQKLGQAEQPHPYTHQRRGFGGDCVLTTQRHFLDRLRQGGPFETEGAEYLKTLAVQEALYESAQRRQPIEIVTSAGTQASPPGKSSGPSSS
jgi:predicted dehydrogenase